ncbi:MAG: pitrilysin family protein [Erysipelotrichaceae bacterium]
MLIKQGIHCHIIKTNKFKDIGISIRFLSKLDENHASEKSLLAMILCDRTLAYPTKKAMSEVSDECYGASLNAQTMGYGQAQVLEIRSKIIDPDYVPNENLLEKHIAFLHEIIFNPRIDEEVMKEAKEVLLAKMQRMHDEPSQYAIHRCLQLAGANIALGISALGTKEKIETITLEQLRKAYDDMIKNDQIELLICGDINETKIQELIYNHLNFEERNSSIDTFYVSKNKELGRIEEYRDVSQTNIMMLYFTNVSIKDDDYWKLKVTNAILGQYPTSFLFQEVREKNSLCYSIYSSLISYDGAMGISTGIEKVNINKTIELIEKQVERIKQGDFDELLLNTSKGMLINSLRQSLDDMNSLFSINFQNAILKQNKEVSDFIEAIEKVSKEDVIKVMKNSTHQLTYILTSQEEQHVEN